jgi:hypothetical protein
MAMPDPLRPATEAEELSYRMRKANFDLQMLVRNGEAQWADDYQTLCECGQWADEYLGQCETCRACRFTCEDCGMMFRLDSLSDRFSTGLHCEVCATGLCENERHLLDELLATWSGQPGEGNRIADLLAYAKSLTPAHESVQPAG